MFEEILQLLCPVKERELAIGSCQFAVSFTWKKCSSAYAFYEPEVCLSMKRLLRRSRPDSYREVYVLYPHSALAKITKSKLLACTVFLICRRHILT